MHPHPGTLCAVFFDSFLKKSLLPVFLRFFFMKPWKWLVTLMHVSREVWHIIPTRASDTQSIVPQSCLSHTTAN